jgi:hypothetical protein
VPFTLVAFKVPLEYWRRRLSPSTSMSKMVDMLEKSDTVANTSLQFSACVDAAIF